MFAALMQRRSQPRAGYVFLVDAADEQERDESLLRRLVNDGQIPAYRVGTRWVIAEPVVELLGQLERPAGPSVPRRWGAPEGVAAQALPHRGATGPAAPGTRRDPADAAAAVQHRGLPPPRHRRG
jgi:hypothetical protein